MLLGLSGREVEVHRHPCVCIVTVASFIIAKPKTAQMSIKRRRDKLWHVGILLSNKKGVTPMGAKTWMESQNHYAEPRVSTYFTRVHMMLFHLNEALEIDGLFWVEKTSGLWLPLGCRTPKASENFLG